MNCSVLGSRRRLSAVAVMMLAISMAGACAKRRAPSQSPPSVPALDDGTLAPGASADARRRDSLAREEEIRRLRERRASARAILNAPVYFGFDQSDLTPDARRRLDEKLPILQANSDVSLLVEGHADERGSDEYNLALSHRRAAAAKRYLVFHGIATARVEIIGHGEERAVCEDPQESCWSRNRRAEFVITAGNPLIATQ